MPDTQGNTPIVQDASGQEFSFVIPITGYVLRSIETDTPPEQNEYSLPPGNWLMVEGWASDASEDKLKGQFTERAIVGMVNCVNHGTYAPVYRSLETARKHSGALNIPHVGIDVDHSPLWTDQIGYVVRAEAVYDLPPEMVARGAKAPAMHTIDAIDLEMSHGRDLKRALDKGVKLGKSVFGQVVEGKREVSRSGELIRERFDLVDLKRIAYTSAPVNNVTWVRAIKRSLTAPLEEEVMDAPLTGDALLTRHEEIASRYELRRGLNSTTLSVQENTLETQTPEQEAPVAAPAEETMDSAKAESAESAVAQEDVKTEAVQGTDAPSETPEPEAAAPSPAAQAEPVVEAPTEPAESPAEASTEAEAPAESAEVTPVSDQATVARALDTMREYFVGMEVFRSFETGIKGLLEQTMEFPKEIQRAMGKVDELTARLAEQDATIAALTERLDKYGKTGTGRLGSVARSFNEEYEGQSGDWTPSEKREIAKQFAERGDQGKAMAVIMDWVKKPLEPGQATAAQAGEPVIVVP